VTAAGNVDDLTWDEAFQRANKYARNNGHAILPRDYVQRDGFPLGEWCHLQRLASRARERRIPGVTPLTEHQHARLTTITGWVWDTPASLPVQPRTWDDKYDLLVAYYREHGHSVVPHDYRTATGFGLGAWTTLQRLRIRYRGSSSSGLSARAQKKLEQIPDWKWELPSDLVEQPRTPAMWTARLAVLKAVATRVGTADLPTSYATPDGVALGEWIRSQRLRYHDRDRDGYRLTQEQIDALEAMPGWTWDLPDPNCLTWDDAFEILRDYARENGHARVPATYTTPDGFTLGRWVYEQRRHKRERDTGQDKPRKRITDEQIRRLNSLPGWAWQIRGPRAHRSWNDTYQALRDYCDENGRLPTKNHRLSNGAPAGEWMRLQRTRYRKTMEGQTSRPLTTREIRLLEALPGWGWGPRPVDDLPAAA
jgi:hypothetical protein